MTYLSIHELQTNVEQLHEASVKIRLEINFSKTIWMRNQFCNKCDIRIRGQIIEEVNNYVYMGHQIYVCVCVVLKRSAVFRPHDKIEGDLFYSVIVSV